MPTLSCLEPSGYLETIMKRLQVIAPASEDEQKNPFVPHSHARDKHSESSQQPPMSDKRWAGSCLSVEAANNLRVQEERRHGGGENRERIESFIAKEETCRPWGPQSFGGHSRSPRIKICRGMPLVVASPCLRGPATTAKHRGQRRLLGPVFKAHLLGSLGVLSV